MCLLYFLVYHISFEMAAYRKACTPALNGSYLCLLQQHKFGHEFQHVISEIRRQHEHTQYLRGSCLLRLQITFRRYEGLMHNRLPQFTITTIISCAVSQVNSAGVHERAWREIVRYTLLS